MIDFKINYFDLGLYRGVELRWVVESIFPSLKIQDYRAFGFEACEKYAKDLERYFTSNSKVEIVHRAISDDEEVKLYHAPNALGHSIYDTKNNVDKTKFETVQGIRFSEWVRENVTDFENSFNILKVNIEGAEFPLFKDICSTGLNKHIQIFCGAGHDVEKIGEFKDLVGDYYSLLESNNIHLLRFTEWKPHQNADIKYEIKKQMIEFYKRRAGTV